VNWILAGALSVLLAGCEPAPPPDTLVVSSDPALKALAEGLLPDITSRTGLRLSRPLRLERRTREELARYLTAQLDAELPPAEERLLTRSYALLGLVPEDLDLRSLLLEVYTEQVAAFYDPDSTALFVLEDQPAEALSTVLVHELVHAVQDQATDLDSLTAKERGNDRQTAAQAAIEGHATLVMIEHMMEKLQGGPVDLSEVEDFAGLLRPALQGIRVQYPMLASAPPVIQESLLFPYLEGAGFTQRLWREASDRPAPFGENLPQSTEQVLHPERFVGAARDDPSDLRLQIEGARVQYSDGLGELETSLMLGEVGSGATGSAAGWDGDRYALLETPAGDALVWVSVWDDTAARDRFAARLDVVVPRLRPPTVLERLSLDGVPAIVLRVGEIEEVQATVVPVGEGAATGDAEQVAAP